MKKNKVFFLSILLAVSAALAEAPAITPKAPAVADTCYQVNNVEELYGFAAIINNDSGFVRDTSVKCMELKADLVVNKKVLTDDWELASEDTASYTPWNPIRYFIGTIKGNGHSISGLFIKQENKDNQLGFFGHFGGRIEDLHIKDSYVEDGHSSVYHYVGGFCGENAGAGNTRYGIRFIKSSFSGTVRSESYMAIGGFVGNLDAMAFIEDSKMSGKVLGKSYMGGFVGQTDSDVSITRSFNEAAIGSENTSGTAAGFVGYASGTFSPDINITESYNKGSVTSSDAAAGFIGYFTHANSKIINSYNSGAIKARSNIGGFIASNKVGGSYPDLVIYNSFNVGTIETSTYTTYMGLQGQLRNTQNLTLDNAFFVKDTLFNDSSTFYGEAIALSDFEDGTLLKTLQAFKNDTIDGSVWYQEIGKDKHPILKSRTTGITPKKSVLANYAKVSVEGSYIKLNNMSPKSKFSIFDLQGCVLKHGVAQGSAELFKVPHAGTFVVKINGTSNIVHVLSK